MTRCNSPEGGVIYTKEAETAAEVRLLIMRIMAVIMLIKMDDKGENYTKRETKPKVMQNTNQTTKESSGNTKLPL